MASLTIQIDDATQAGVITGRVLIGRKPFNTIAIDHPAVSRLHAWIERRDGAWWIGDCGARNGTFVNARRITRRTRLEDGDRITVAHATLVYHDRDDLPAGAAPIRLEQADDRLTADHNGFLFDCACGAPTWVPNHLAGRVQTCGHCHQQVQIPPAPAANLSDAPPADDAPPILCSICQCPISRGESQTHCPDCGLAFHGECWEENLGCSAYGCSQVNVLAEPQAPARPPLPNVAPAFADADALAAPARGIPWDYALLGGGVLGGALGILAFGIPSLAILIVAMSYIPRAPRERRMITSLAAVVSVAGLAAGLAASYLWWLK